jgi:hypothetical protein
MINPVEKVRSTVYTVGLGAELVARVVAEVAGNDISNTINNVPATLPVIGQIATARFQADLKLNKV